MKAASLLRSFRAVLEAYPRLARVHFWRRASRIRLSTQRYPTDCGAACLTMIAGYFGSDLTLQDIHDYGGASRLGWNARDFVRAAETIGLRAKVLKIENLDDLRWLDRPVVLHWKFKHFVVLERCNKKGALIADPAGGRQWKSWDALDRDFTGVMLWFERGADASPVSRHPEPSRFRLLVQLIAGTGLVPTLFACALLLQLLALVPSLLAGFAFGNVLAKGETHWMIWLLAAFAVTTAMHVLVDMLKGYVAVAFRGVTTAHLGSEVTDRLLKTPLIEIQKRAQGQLLMGAQTADSVCDTLADTGINAVLDLMLLVGALVALLVLFPAAGLSILALAILMLAVLTLTSRRRSELMTAAFNADAEKRGFLNQLLAGMETIRCGRLVPWASDRWGQHAVRELNASADLARHEVTTGTLMSSIGIAAPMMVALILTWIAAGGGVTLQKALVVYTIALTALSAFTRCLQTFVRFHGLGFQAARVNDVLDLPMPQSSSGRPRHVLGAAASIQVDNVRFRYAPNSAWTLDGVDLEIPSRAFALVAGPSGSGKSTLLSLMSGLYTPDEGYILIGSVPLSGIDDAASVRPIVHVPQFPYLFGGSIRDNIALGRADVSLDEIINAAKLAVLHQDIEALPMGYETMLGDGGSGLSGGQCQRLALARAILAKPSILLLDEATSALDADTESKVLHNLAQLDCTRILATHRLSLAALADRIIVVERGRIAEVGTAEELLATPGLFARLAGNAAPAPISRTSSPSIKAA